MPTPFTPGQYRSLLIGMQKPSAPTHDLHTICDLVRYATSRFTEARLAFGHGTDNAFDEAAFMVLEALKLPIDQLEPFWQARVTSSEKTWILELIDLRIRTRQPASYLLNKAYIQGLAFYVDERVIVPRSFIAEILGGEASPVDNLESIGSVLDLCTGSGCLAILAAHLFPRAQIDAVDLSADALDVARRNIDEYGLGDRITLHEGDLFAPLTGKTYDLILTNPPYVDDAAMDALPPEYRAEPVMALTSGRDGLDHVRRIVDQAADHLTPAGAMMCELGRGGPELEKAYPALPFRWLSTENSAGEVFWITRRALAGN